MHFLPQIPIFRLCFATRYRHCARGHLLRQALAASSQLKRCVVDFGGSCPSLQCCPAVCPAGPSVLLCDVVPWGHAFSPPCALCVSPLGGRGSQLLPWCGMWCRMGQNGVGWDSAHPVWPLLLPGLREQCALPKGSPPAVGSLSPGAMMPPPQWLIVGHAVPCPDLCRRVCCLPSPRCSSSKAALVLVHRRNPNLASMQPSRRS